MDSETEHIGKISKTHSNWCEISANISGTHAVLFAHRRRFYKCGIRCVGDMRTFVAEGTCVKFCLAYTRPTPVVSIAWLGDKPEVKEDEPETVYQGKGVITQIASNACEMCALINGTRESLSFRRRMFFAFGIRCDGNGSLTNILEEGMEVDFFYVVRESKIVVIAAWLGEKPDRNRIDDVLEAVYNTEGKIRAIVDTERCIVHSDHVPGIVLVNARFVFRHGVPNAVDLAVGDDITFDAVPMESEDETGAKFKATCAWTGEAPSLVDRFSLNSPDDDDSLMYDLKYFQENCIDGTVAVIVNELVAFVDVEYDGYVEQVLLFRSSFQRDCKARLQDVVRVGDKILVRLGIGSILPGCKRLYAAEAWRNIQEKNACMAEAQIAEPKELPTPMSDVEMDYRPEPSQNPSLVARFNANSKVLYPNLTGVIFPYSAKQEIRKSKQKCLALIRSTGTDSVLSLVDVFDFYVNGNVFVQRKTFASILRSEKSTVVQFDGVLNPRPNSKIANFSDERFSHVAACAWVGRRPSFKTVVARARVPRAPLTRLPPKKARLVGTVTKFYLPDKAIVTIWKRNQIVCVHASSFPPESDAGLISDCVKLGQRISFQVVSDPHCELPVLAVNVKLRM